MKIDNRFLSIERLVESSYQNDDFTIDTICATLGISRTTLHRLVKRQTGLSTTTYINYVRLARALQILQLEYTTVKEVAHKVGFRDPKYFSKIFKHRYGISPSQIDG